jgi:hypothetical protein
VAAIAAVFALLLNDRVFLLMIPCVRRRPDSAASFWLAPAAGALAGHGCSCSSTTHARRACACTRAAWSGFARTMNTPSQRPALKDARHESCCFVRVAIAGFLLIVALPVGAGRGASSTCRSTATTNSSGRSDSNRILDPDDRAEAAA